MKLASRVVVREAIYYMGAAANLLIQPFNNIVGGDTSSVLTGKIAINQSFLYAALYQLFGCLLITFSFSRTIFSDMVYYFLSNGGVATSFYQMSTNHVFFVFAKLILPDLIFAKRVLNSAGWGNFQIFVNKNFRNMGS